MDRSRDIVTVSTLACLSTICCATSSNMMAAQQAPGEARVQLNSGAVLVGNALKSVDEFLGIPYAEPPIGKMRWRPPADLELPAEDFLARSFGPSCPQYGGQLANASTRCFTLSPTDYCSEDCLTLNVWRPHSYRGTNPLPILFWIHGGGFTQGGSSEFNGTSLASLHSVVVISTNYRLGPLGFLAIPGLEDSNATNAGMMDQQSALRWAQKHATAFGGDPTRVTLFGQSAGGGAVLTHMMMPASKGLFHRAMMESGGPFHFRPDAAAARAAVIADRVGCGGSETPSTTLECLRGVSVDKLQDAAGNPSNANQVLDCSQSVANCTDFAPIFGVPNLPNDVLSVLLMADPTAALPAAVPLIFGHTPDDAMLFIVDTDDGTTDPNIADANNYAYYVNASLRSRAYLSDFPETAAAALPRVLAAYKPIDGNYSHNLAMIGALLTDVEFVCGSRLLASALGRHALAPATYDYLFTYNATWKHPCDLTFPAAYGVCHTAELSFVWGQPVYSFGKVTVPCEFNEEEATFAAQIGNLVTRFAASGDPGSGWVPWSSSRESIVLYPSQSGFDMKSSDDNTRCDMWRDIWASRSFETL